MAEAGPLIDDEYLKEHHLHVYLEDAIAQMLANRQEGNKSPTMKPSKFFKEYFTSVHQGTHVLFREYEFVSATPYNRLCVLKAILQIYKSFLYSEERYNVRDYHSILQLVWPDFRMQVVQDAFNASDDDKKDEENRMKFLDFVKALKESFCTGDFDYEAGIMNDQLNERIEECSNIDPSVNFADQLNAEDSVGKSPWSKILDGSEFKRILSLNDSNSVSSDEPISGAAGKLSHSSSESKEVSKSEKTKKTKKSEGKGKTRGRLPGKHLSSSLNLLQNEKGDDKKGKHRHRSKSAVADQRKVPKKPPWSEEPICSAADRKEISTSKKTPKTKTFAVKQSSREFLEVPTKFLSIDLNLLQQDKDDGKKERLRRNSASAVPDQGKVVKKPAWSEEPICSTAGRKEISTSKKTQKTKTFPVKDSAREILEVPAKFLSIDLNLLRKDKDDDKKEKLRRNSTSAVPDQGKVVKKPAWSRTDADDDPDPVKNLQQLSRKIENFVNDI